MNQRLANLCALLCSTAGLPACVPSSLGKAETYFARRYRVTDASVRRVRGAWDLRFDAHLINKLQHVGDTPDVNRQKEQLQSILQEANDLACRSAANEIHRMPPATLQALARRAVCSVEASSIVDAYCSQAAERTGQRIVELTAEVMTQDEVLLIIDEILQNLEPTPDARGRLLRMVLLNWGIVPAWIGIENTEQQLDNDRSNLLNRPFEHASAYPCTNAATADPVSIHAPLIIQEESLSRTYDADVDCFGEVHLTGTRQDIHVQIDARDPTVYYYTSQARIHDKLFDQIVYVWWYPRQPARQFNDPEAGNIDGATIRITLDSNHKPAVFEILQACGCGHLVFVGNDLEKRAKQQFKAKSGKKSFYVEKDVESRRDLIVAGTIQTDQQSTHPVVYVQAGDHAIVRIRFESDAIKIKTTNETRPYQLEPYEQLQQLPLGSGVASMFGPDGLVHHAGRKEGYLLAPTGMLSAGQPRQRGTLRIRWDEYDFDDPQLLDKTLRLPDDF